MFLLFKQWLQDGEGEKKLLPCDLKEQSSKSSYCFVLLVNIIVLLVNIILQVTQNNLSFLINFRMLSHKLNNLIFLIDL